MSAERMSITTDLSAKLRSFFLGQTMSVVLMLSGLFTEFINNRGFRLPTSQNFVLYLFLAMYCFPIVKQRKALREPPWKYAVLALFDVEANFLFTKAFQYTSFTSVMVLDCMVAPTCMLLSRLFLSVTYNALQLLGAALTVSGLLLVVYSDSESPSDSRPASHAVLGDAMALVAACLFSVSSVSQEVMTRSAGVAEYLGLLGSFGAFISCVQVVALSELPVAVAALREGTVVLLILGNAISLALCYSLGSVLCVWSSAVMMTLSFMTSDLYSLLIGKKGS